jgi:hypothetical protein
MRVIEAKTFSGYGGLQQTELPKPQPVKDRVLVRGTADIRSSHMVTQTAGGNLMCTPLSSAHPQARLATSRLVTHVKCVVALGAVLAVSACDGMEVGSVPHCGVLQASCSDFEEGPAAPATAASSSPKTLAHSHSPNITSQ